jgi:abortive infection bacteriophage resistance protein
MKILLDLEKLDKQELTEEHRKQLVNQLLLISHKARKYLKRGKLSKIMYNRIHSLWLFLPRDKAQKEFMPFEEYTRLFHIKSLDLKKLKIALIKLGELSSKQEEYYDE